MGKFEDLGKIQKEKIRAMKREQEEGKISLTKKVLGVAAIGFATKLAFGKTKNFIRNSSKINRYASKFVAGLDEIKNNIESKDIYNFTLKDYKDRLGAFKRGFKNPVKYSIHSDPNSALHTIVRGVSLRETAEHGTKRALEKEIWLKTAADGYQKTKGMEFNRKVLMERTLYTDRFHTKFDANMENEFRKELVKKRLSSEEVKIIKQAREDFLRLQKDDTARQLAKDSAENVNKQVADKMLDVELLNKKYGNAKGSQVSLGDIIKDKNKWQNETYTAFSVDAAGNTVSTERNVYDDVKAFYDTLGKKEQKIFRKTAVSNSIMKDANKNIYDTSGVDRITSEIGDFFADSLPGKIVNARGFLEQQKGEMADFMIRAGTHSHGIANLVGKDSAGRLEHDVYRINGEVFVSKGGQLVHDANISDNFHVISGKYARESNINDAMAGHLMYKENPNKFLSFFDIGQDYENPAKVTNYIKALFNKNSPDYITNQFGFLNSIEGMFSDADTFMSKAENVVTYLRENSAIDFNLADKQELASLENSNINKLLDITRIQDVNQKREALHSLVNEIATNAGDTNPIASHMANAMNRDKNVYDVIYRKTAGTSEVLTSNILTQGLNINQTVAITEKDILTQKANDLIVHELSASGLIEGPNAITNLSSDAKSIIAASSVENAIQGEETLLTQKDAVLTALSGDNVYNYADETIKNNTNFLETVYEKSDVYSPSSRENRWAFRRNSATLRSVLNILDHKDPMGALEETKRIFTQFTAGRNNMEDVTALTQAPYYMAYRLNEVGEFFGLGLSRESTKSTGDLIKGIAFKRILPGAIAYNQLQYADDQVEDATGLAPSAAFVAGVANIDVNARRVMDATGATKFLKKQYEINPIMRYWGDGGEFYDSEQLTDYYANGYTAVRSAAWWTFGGVNEARGGKIEYWAPTITRRMASDYHDKSLYGSNDEKWAHSLMPTLTHPFSTLNYLMNPYWLEEKHADDRPYPVSGKMFADGTPWGAILNPTIGELIKPQKELHTNRLIGGVDIKALYYAFTRAANEDDTYKSVVLPKTGGAQIMRKIKYDMADRNKRIKHYSVVDGEIRSTKSDTHNQLNQKTPVPLIKSYTNEEGKGVENSDYLKAVNKNKVITGDGTFLGLESERIKNRELAWYDKEKMMLMASPDKEGINGLKNEFLDIVDNIVTKHTGKNRIQRIKKITKDLKEDNKIADALDYNEETDESKSFTVKDKLRNYKPSQSLELLNDPELVGELINSKKGEGLVDDMEKSTRLITGIYGYMAGATLDFGSDYEKRIATSQDMESFSRTFWDENYGGAGGSVMEIIRRFIPTYRRSKMVNPLMNTMPDWLPERFRFSDPFTMIARGEARLPGVGYESLNELHPDSYGKYGAFDRFKILADVAPNSAEYKVWKEIASKSVIDPKLKEEMKKIRERTSRQGRKYDFYDYQVLGKDVDYQNIIVSEVLGYGRFRSGDTIYKLAGVKVKGNENETMSDVLGRYLKVGQEITIATDANDAYLHNKDSVNSVNAAVFIKGESLAETMEENGDAERRKGDNSAAGIYSRYGSMQRMLAGAAELVAHADLPILSDQWLRVRDPYEAYRKDEVYGNSYQSWEHPLDTFLFPAIERGIHDRNVVSTFYENLYNNKILKSNNKLARVGGMYLLMHDRSYLVGAALGIVAGKPGLAHKMGMMSSNVALGAHVLTGGNSMFDQMSAGADLGWKAAKFFGAKTKFAKVGGAVTGALFASTVRIVRGGSDEWVPERTLKRWSMQEYFDRLTYVKYKALYEEAAKKAKSKEGFDVKKYVKDAKKKAEKNSRKKKYYERLKKRLKKNSRNQPLQKAYLKLLSQMENVEEENQDIKEIGEWGRTALLYKKAMDSTMFGLSKDSSWVTKLL